jgi:hypothetical protein
MQLISGSPKIVNSADLLPPVVDDDLSVAVDLYMPSVVAVAPVSEIHMMLLSKALMEKTAKSLEVSLISATTMTLAPPASAPVGLELAVCEAAVLLLLWIVVYFLVLLHLSPSSLGLLSAQDSVTPHHHDVSPSLNRKASCHKKEMERNQTATKILSMQTCHYLEERMMLLFKEP